MSDKSAGIDQHDRQVATIVNAVGRLAEQFAYAGLTPEAVFEGAIKGAAACLLAATPLTAAEVGALIIEIGESISALDDERANHRQ